MITFHKISSAVSAASEIPGLFKRSGIEYVRIAGINCPKFGYVPDVRVGAAHNGDNLLIHYIVDEKTTQALYLNDFEKVWMDSCCELFVAFAGDDGYYNIECNCIGTLLSCYGQGRHDREKVPLELLSRVDRWSSLPKQVLRETAVGRWELALLVPASTFFRSGISSFDGLRGRGNFYKCAQGLTTSHFLTCEPAVSPENPDFHCPDKFGDIRFE